jgi:CRISPR/Cas system CSM-associated protein Csm4 (group 5 of RAMP superfamily)
VDALHATHANMQGHTDGATSFGWGVVHKKSAKQKLNTKSTTESEVVVALSKFVPHTILTTNFLRAQGYNLEKCGLYQDNESAIKMEKNGRNSCVRDSRHISIRCFCVND